MIENNNIFVYIVSGIIGLGLLIWNVVIFFRTKKLSSLLKDFTQGKDGKKLEDVIIGHEKNIDDLYRNMKKVAEKITEVDKNSTQGVRKVNIERYNPFKDVGGDQSFSLAMLDGKNSGVVISSLHGRDGTRLYAKPINHLSSDHPLSTEEQKTLQHAREL